ncbi:MAG: hypothetical protein OEO21_07885 [Candidatus Krumholzibacteria bacterium]|nr:hypothetical protein [Candidatus Krumholzibacteria bacterium]
MKRTYTLLPAALLALVLVWTGCQSTADVPSVGDELLTREQVVDFDDEYGGFNFGDESPAFADPYLATTYGPEADVAYIDPMEDDPAVTRARLRERELQRAHRYLMITWGSLRADSTINFVTDWSGSLSVENGVVLLKRTIAFDARDEILPRTSRDLLEWVSYTRPHFDGIVVALHKLAHKDTMPDDNGFARGDTAHAPLQVTFATEPLTVTFTEDELANLHRVIRVDDHGNAVAFNTVAVMPQPCPSGFLAGQWRDVEDRPGGAFRGKWISHNGLHMGYLRGVYGPNSRGEKVFFGKWINHGGQFYGLLKGRYGAFGDRPGGWFEGVWFNRARHAMGGLKGEWRVGDDITTVDNASRGGYFRGVWAQRCPTTDLR